MTPAWPSRRAAAVANRVRGRGRRCQGQRPPPDRPQRQTAGRRDWNCVAAMNCSHIMCRQRSGVTRLSEPSRVTQTSGRLPGSRSGGALRMARHRKRRGDGLRCLRIEIREAEIDALIELGLLRNDARQNRNAILSAVYTSFDRTLGRIV
jgi:hypothetical protein